MRRWIRCLFLGLLGIALVRHVGAWSLGSHPGEPAWWGALSFALAAVVDDERAA